MPLLGERAGRGPGAGRVFVFLDGLEFIAGEREFERVLEPLLDFGSYRYCKNRLEESHLLLERVHDAHAVFLDWSRLDAAVLASCPQLEIVSYIGVGAANFVDIEEATRRGIVVTNTPDYGNRSVAEHALGLILAVARNIARGDRDLRAGRWTSAEREGVQVSGRSIGLVGLGAVGREMARLCHALGMQVFYFDPRRQPEMEDIAAYLDLDELLSRCDVVSLHVAYTPETRDLIGERELSLMKPGSILVNTSRGEVLDLRARAVALREGRILGAGLDNFPGEPRPDLSELVALENVVLTPHIAFNAREAKDRMTAIAVENVVSFYRGRPRNVMNPEALRIRGPLPPDR
ncbi:MAG: 2-hydroxyacid dehydrogenase [Actinomycetota bacterium]